VPDAEGAANTHGLCRAVAGDPAGAVPELQAALHAVTDPYAEGRAAAALGASQLWAGQAERALGHLRRALDLADAHRYPGLGKAAAGWAVTAAVEAGAHGDAIVLAGVHLARAVDDGDEAAAAGLRADLAELHRQHGDVDGAIALARASADAGAPEAWLVLAAARLDCGAADVGEELAAAEAALAADGWLAWRTRARAELVRARGGDPAGLERALAGPGLSGFQRAEAELALGRPAAAAALVEALDAAMPATHALAGRIRKGPLASALDSTPGG
jgi:hypothetical protein